MVGSAALAEKESQVVKISSKRQITIPSKCYEEAGFGDYALCTWSETGLTLEPIAVDDEDLTVDILRHLIAQGVEGDDLIAKYQEMKKKIVSVKNKLQEAEQDIEDGNVDSWDGMMKRVREKNGL
jgi:hypothetical protein